MKRRRESAALVMVILASICHCHVPRTPKAEGASASAAEEAPTETFKAELFLNDGDLNSGLYEGAVRGRKRFGGSQIPHGHGVINYFTNDALRRLNYTGEWRDGNRQGRGTTWFRDGAVYVGEYEGGVEHGEGRIEYQNGNVLDGEFEDGRIQGHAVFRYPNGDQREGFFNQNILYGQVIFTESSSGRTVIELWRGGRRVDGEEQVVQEGEGAPPPSPPTPAPTTRATSTTPLPVSSTAGEAQSATPNNSLTRKGERSREFYFGGVHSSRRGEDDEGATAAAAEAAREMSRRLRTETERERRSMLLDIFEAAHSRRRRRRRRRDSGRGS